MVYFEFYAKIASIILAETWPIRRFGGDGSAINYINMDADESMTAQWLQQHATACRVNWYM